MFIRFRKFNAALSRARQTRLKSTIAVLCLLGVLPPWHPSQHG